MFPVRVELFATKRSEQVPGRYNRGAQVVVRQNLVIVHEESEDSLPKEIENGCGRDVIAVTARLRISLSRRQTVT